ncbi:MAG: nucleotidyltransferase domain-containing protein [Clostridiales bacterium]|nr:nucleotidyltransferase domain-containing protein [Clostridiales bacterium]
MVRKLKLTGEPIRVDAELARLPAVFARYTDLAAAFLHGSYGTSDQTPLSDVDLALVYRPGRLPTLDEELRLIGDVEDTLGIEDVSITVLNRAPLPFQFRVVANGRLLYCADAIALADFQERVCKLYGDFVIDYERFLAEYDQALLEAYGDER